MISFHVSRQCSAISLVVKRLKPLNMDMQNNAKEAGKVSVWITAPWQKKKESAVHGQMMASMSSTHAGIEGW